MRERLEFRHFYDALALCGAIAEWGLACWLIRVAPPWPIDILIVAVLAVLNRLAARRCEQEPATGIFAGRTGGLVLGTAFGAIVCAGALAALASGWVAVWLLGALSAQAGMIGHLGAEPIVGAGFRWLGSAAIALTAAAVAYGYVVGYRQLTVTSLAVTLPGLRPPLPGLRVVHVSDLHMGPLGDRAALREAVDRIVALAPDLVCVTGDLVDSPATDLGAWMPELARITARHGVFAILGNHDRGVGADRVAAAVARWTSWRVLRDEVATVEVGGARLHLVGLEDRPAGEEADTLRALAARIPRDEPAIVLAHRPDVVETAAEAGLRLVLAGHTHGGQLAVPGIPRLNVARLLLTNLDAGTFTRGHTVVHVNRGLGTSGQRVRIGAPREISVLTLVAAGESLTPSRARC